MRHLRHINYNLLLRMQKGFSTGLKLKNSLSNELEEFIPADGNNVTWYTCGPTVYSNSHMGHARNYICNDIIRRVMKDHFGYNLKFGMNITDVEDKIIKGSNDEKIDYFQFARRWEADYFQDMDTLGVLRPDYLSRVTQYMPEIVGFIERIIKNGYAYESKGDVYFDIEAYRKNFKYGKLKRVPEAQTEAEEVDEKKLKKNKQDFALWKAAKPEEPKWPSPWGQGRPGWHIECSAMATSILGKKLDIHSGGIDLIFPHHENQLAQSEAYYNQPEWVKYFIHIGHLHIDGLKMSKSLKNFITIKNLTEKVSPRVIRLFFAMHKFDVLLDYNRSTSLQEAQNKDNRYKNLIGALKVFLRQEQISKPQKLDAVDVEFDEVLQATKIKIHEELCNNIHTPGVFDALDNAIKKTNIYLATPAPKLTLILKTYNFINQNFKKMGLFYASEESSANQNKELVDAIVNFRNSVRQNAKSQFKTILQICDNFRDNAMVDLGIKILDKSMKENSTWMYESKEVMLKEKQKKLEEERQKLEKAKLQQQKKLKQMSVNPAELFKNDAQYTQFDENGIPTHQKGKDADIPIKQAFRKKLVKQWETQKVQYQKYLAEYANKQPKVEQAEEKKQ